MQKKILKKLFQNIKPIWGLFSWVFFLVILFSFISGNFLFSQLQGTLIRKVEIEENVSAEEKSSIFRYKGQRREDYIQTQEFVNMRETELRQLIYIEEYNRRNLGAEIKTYTNEKGEKYFAGYTPNRLSLDKIRKKPLSMQYRGRNKSSKDKTMFYRLAKKKSRVRDFLEKRRGQREKASKKSSQTGIALTDENTEKILLEDMNVPKTKPLVLSKNTVIRENPTVKLSYFEKKYKKIKQYKIFIVFSDSIYNFNQDDLSIINGKIISFKQINKKTFMVDVVHRNSLESLRIFVPENRANDRYNRTNTESNMLEFFQYKKPMIQVRIL